MNYMYLVGAVILMCIAHWIRLIRWELFIGVYEKPDHKNLLLALTIGYLFNYILPFKMGDLIRAWMSGRRLKNGKALGFSTVLVDRYFDIVSVGLIFIVLTFMRTGGAEKTGKTAFFYVVVAVVLLAAAVTLYTFKGYVKRVIINIARIFNPVIESSILCFAWALIWNFKDIFQKINKVKLLITTLGMWLLYLYSYYLFASFLTSGGGKTTWIDIFTMLFAQNGVSSSTGDVTVFWQSRVMYFQQFYLYAYLLLPLLVLLILAFVLKRQVITAQGRQDYLNLLPHLDPDERLAFLENYFSDKNRDYVSNYLKINQDISIIRDYSAGSNATTMLCMDSEKTFFRKYAFGDDGRKLYQQVQWIQENSNRLPLPAVLKYDSTDLYCYYDMPYSSHTVGLFEYVHSMPVDQGWMMIQRTLNCLEKSIYTINRRSADSESVRKYIDEKVLKNLNRIKTSKRLGSILEYDTIVINGVEYQNLSYYDQYLNSDYLMKIFEQDMCAVIHGDLTIENVVCTRAEDGSEDFYLIDPNTGNIHDSPNLDYAKLLQSIHGGYEFLMSTKDVTVNGNAINFLFTRSSAYLELHKRLNEYLLDHYGRECTRSIYFHEIVHWLRLMPYKLEKDGRRAILFYAGFLMVLHDVIQMFGKDS